MSFELHENLQKQKSCSHFKNLDSLNSQKYTEIYSILTVKFWIFQFLTKPSKSTKFHKNLRPTLPFSPKSVSLQLY